MNQEELKLIKQYEESVTKLRKIQGELTLGSEGFIVSLGQYRKGTHSVRELQLVVDALCAGIEWGKTP